MRSCTCQRLIRCVSCTVFVCVLLGGHIGVHASLEPLGQSCSAMALGRILWTFLWSCFSFSRSRWKCFGGLPQAFGRCWSICANFVGSLFEASLSRWRYWSLSINTRAFVQFGDNNIDHQHSMRCLLISLWFVWLWCNLCRVHCPTLRTCLHGGRVPRLTDPNRATRLEGLTHSPPLHAAHLSGTVRCCVSYLWSGR